MSVRVGECVLFECVLFVSRLHATWQACQYANLIKEGSRHDLVVREAVKLRTQFGRIA